MLTISTASVTRSGRQILDRASLEVRPGSLLILIGPNGAGKSTALKVLSGELPVDAGRARLDGLDLAHWRRDELARRRAVLSQNVTLAFGFSVFDVVEMGRRPHSECSRIFNRRIVRAALAAVDMLDFSRRDYQTLSGGEQQRVQLARVLAQIWPEEKGGNVPRETLIYSSFPRKRESNTLNLLDSRLRGNDGNGINQTYPRYLLLDEPVTGLDPAHQHALLSHAQRRAKQGYGVLAVLHDLNLASQYADYVAIMRGGRIFYQGSPEDTFTRERIHAAFGVSADISVHPQTMRPQLVMWSGTQAYTAPNQEP